MNEGLMLVIGLVSIAGMVYLIRNETKPVAKPPKPVARKNGKRNAPKKIGFVTGHIYDCNFGNDSRRVVLRAFLKDGFCKVQVCGDGSEHTVHIGKMTPA